MKEISVILVFMILVNFEVIETDSKKVTKGDEIIFTSQHNLQLTFLKKVINNGNCEQPLIITYPGGLTQTSVAKCDEKLEEGEVEPDGVFVVAFLDEGLVYSVGRVLYSRNPQTVVVISPTDKCVWYHNKNEKLEGPKELEEKECTEIKQKLKIIPEDSPFKLIFDTLHDGLAKFNLCGLLAKETNPRKQEVKKDEKNEEKKEENKEGKKAVDKEESK